MLVAEERAGAWAGADVRVVVVVGTGAGTMEVEVEVVVGAAGGGVYIEGVEVEVGGGVDVEVVASANKMFPRYVPDALDPDVKLNVGTIGLDAITGAGDGPAAEGAPF